MDEKRHQTLVIETTKDRAVILEDGLSQIFVSVGGEIADEAARQRAARLAREVRRAGGIIDDDVARLAGLRPYDAGRLSRRHKIGRKPTERNQAKQICQLLMADMFCLEVAHQLNVSPGLVFAVAGVMDALQEANVQ